MLGVYVTCCTTGRTHTSDFYYISLRFGFSECYQFLLYHYGNRTTYLLPMKHRWIHHRIIIVLSIPMCRNTVMLYCHLYLTPSVILRFSSLGRRTRQKHQYSALIALSEVHRPVTGTFVNPIPKICGKRSHDMTSSCLSRVSNQTPH